MILSDRSIREALAAGRIGIDPLDESCIQPSSVDLHLDRYFRVFLNHTMQVIDVKEDQEDLTELVEVKPDDVFILHPGEFVLGSTAERVRLPEDLVARLEGKSSLGRLGLLIHSSLPGSERVLIADETGVQPRPIEEIVQKRVRGSVVAFDPDTFEVGYHEITGWYQGPPDRIYEVELRSGRSVRVTAAHTLFTLDRRGDLTKTRTCELRPGTRVATPQKIPEPQSSSAKLDLMALVPEAAFDDLVIEGPAVTAAFTDYPLETAAALKQTGRRHVSFYRARRRLPLSLALQLPIPLTGADRLSVRGSSRGLPLHIDVDAELAWLLGLYVAEGSRRRGQITVSNTNSAILDRAEAVFAALGFPVCREPGKVTCCCAVLSEVFRWLEMGTNALEKRVPKGLFGWPLPLVESFAEGFVDGDGSRQPTRISWWTSSGQLCDDLLYLATRLGRRASASFRLRGGRGLYQISLPLREHKLLTSVPLPDQLLIELRHAAGLKQARASTELGFKHASDLNNLERRSGRVAARLRTLRRLHTLYAHRAPAAEALPKLSRIVDGGLLWDEVVAVRDTGTVETVYDLEVRPNGRKIENFLAGTGGVFVANTAGFVDAGWDGHLTLELSNVANLPITLYPGMKIGQISFLLMTTPADAPYGSKRIGSKYQGQRGPTPSRYFENFRDQR